MKAVLCVPTVRKPYQETLDAIQASVALLDAAGIEHGMVSEVGNPYISCARATMLRKAMDAHADVVVFIDHDVSWKPENLLTLIQTKGDVVCGTYRFKTEPEEYMGMVLTDANGYPLVDSDGLLSAHSAPAGFLKITSDCVDKFMRGYPHLVYGKAWHPHVDLFNHGAADGVWYGEDYGFCRHWREIGGQIRLIPNLDITHHGADGTAYPGNFHYFLARQEGGALHGVNDDDR